MYWLHTDNDGDDVGVRFGFASLFTSTAFGLHFIKRRLFFINNNKNNNNNIVTIKSKFKSQSVKILNVVIICIMLGNVWFVQWYTFYASNFVENAYLSNSNYNVKPVYVAFSTVLSCFPFFILFGRLFVINERIFDNNKYFSYKNHRREFLAKINSKWRYYGINWALIGCFIVGISCIPYAIQIRINNGIILFFAIIFQFLHLVLSLSVYQTCIVVLYWHLDIHRKKLEENLNLYEPKQDTIANTPLSVSQNESTDVFTTIYEEIKQDLPDFESGDQDSYDDSINNNNVRVKMRETKENEVSINDLIKWDKGLNECSDKLEAIIKPIVLPLLYFALFCIISMIFDQVLFLTHEYSNFESLWWQLLLFSLGFLITIIAILYKIVLLSDILTDSIKKLGNLKLTNTYDPNLWMIHGYFVTKWQKNDKGVPVFDNFVINRSKVYSLVVFIIVQLMILVLIFSS